MNDIKVIASGDNLALWDSVKDVPAQYLKTIPAGRLKGMSDISPQWRLQILTEVFGPAGFGWYYEIVDRGKEDFAGEVSAHVLINLYVKVGGEWSKPIPGIGGSMLVASEKNGPHHSDEAFKMALTDALSVACKALGIAASVYLGHAGKYGTPAPEAPLDLSVEIRVLEAAQSMDGLAEAWNQVTKAHRNNTEAISRLTQVKEARKRVLSVVKVMEGSEQS